MDLDEARALSPRGWKLRRLARGGCAEPRIHRLHAEAPKEPITINLNIKLDADVRLRIEEKAKEDVQTQPIF